MSSPGGACTAPVAWLEKGGTLRISLIIGDAPRFMVVGN